jgi:hypothetical protein
MNLIIPWKRQIVYWILAVGFSTLFLMMDTSIGP